MRQGNLRILPKSSGIFIWNDGFTLTIGKTPIGRATVETLQLNREGCINLRNALFAFGKHPPSEKIS